MRLAIGDVITITVAVEPTGDDSYRRVRVAVEDWGEATELCDWSTEPADVACVLIKELIRS